MLHVPRCRARPPIHLLEREVALARRVHAGEEVVEEAREDDHVLRRRAGSGWMGKVDRWCVLARLASLRSHEHLSSQQAQLHCPLPRPRTGARILGTLKSRSARNSTCASTWPSSARRRLPATTSTDLIARRPLAQRVARACAGQQVRRACAHLRNHQLGRRRMALPPRETAPPCPRSALRTSRSAWPVTAGPPAGSTAQQTSSPAPWPPQSPGA